MPTKRIFITHVLLLCFMLIFQACAKSTIVTSWMDETGTDYRMDKVLVIAIFKDSISQKIYEKSFVDLLNKAGVQAFAGSSYKLGPDEPHQGAIDSALEQTEATSVLITHILSETTDSYTIAPMDYYVGYGGSYDSIHGFHTYVYERTFAPAETVEKRHERMAVTLLDGATEKPVWSAISESINLEERLQVDDKELERLFINDLKKKKIL